MICLLHDQKVHLSSPGYHRHHTVAAKVAWHYTDDMVHGLYLPVVLPAQEGAQELTGRINAFVCRQIGVEHADVRVSSAFLDLLCQLDRCARRSHNLQLPSEQLYVQRAKAYIQQHIHAPITQQEVAMHLGITPGYLCRVFKGQERMPLMTYVNRLKLEQILTLVQRENRKVYEAAKAYGYSDPNYVSRLFKRLYGYNLTQSPLLFHEEIKK